MSENDPRKPGRGSLLERAAQRLDAAPPAPTPTPVRPVAAPRRPTVEVAAPAIPRASVLAPGSSAPAAPPRREPEPGQPALRPMLKAGDDARPVVSQAVGDLRKSRRDEIDLEALREQGFILPDSPTTAIAEEFRIIKRQLLMNAMASGTNAIRNGNIILVCSSQPNEGKTFCAINLALSIASERDLTVMLIDADFAKPEILSTLGLEGGKGLLDLIIEPSLDLAECLIRTNIENFAVLPAGRQHNLTTELLASERMGEIIEDIAKRYPDRIIVVDSPPVLASSAAPVLAMYVGQTVYVVEAENTRDAEVREGISMLSACDHIQLLLNKARYSPGGRRYGTYYGYGV